MAGERLSVTVVGEERVLATRARLADTFWTRLWGLLGTASLEVGDGLILDPCDGVHTMGMRYPIDVIFATGEGEVLAVVPALPPRRATRRVRGARIVIEVPPGSADGLKPGDRLEFAQAASTGDAAGSRQDPQP